MTMYLYGNPNTKKLDLTRKTPLDSSQLSGRVEVSITSSHAAYYDKDRLVHFKINDTNDGIELSGEITNQEEINMCVQGYKDLLTSMGYSVATHGDYSASNIISFMQSEYDAATDKSEINIKFCKINTMLMWSIAFGHEENKR